MKTVIGQVRVYPVKDKYNSLRLYFQQQAVDVLGYFIVLNIRKLKIRRPTIDDDKTHKIKNLFTSTHLTDEDDLSKYVGKFNIIQLDEDTFKLRKIGEND